jgi:hypothetical protein
LDYATEKDLETGLGEIIASLLEMMRYHFKPRGPIRSQATLPLIISSQCAEIAEPAILIAVADMGGEPEQIIPEQAEYIIRASMRSADINIRLTVRLEKSDKVLRVWDENFAAADQVEKQKDLAYKVLIFLKEYIQDEYAH